MGVGFGVNFPIGLGVGFGVSFRIGLGVGFGVGLGLNLGLKGICKVLYLRYEHVCIARYGKK